MSEKKRQRVQSRYRAEVEDVERLSKSLTKLERQYQQQQLKHNQEVDKRLQEIRERYKPVDYSALKNFSVAYDSRKVQKKIELDERQREERSRNKNILPLLKSYHRTMSKTPGNFHKGFFAKKRDKVIERVNKMKGYGNYVKKHFLPPITTKNATEPDNELMQSERKRERFKYSVANTAEEKLEEYSIAARTREIGINYLKELREELKQAKAENRIKKEVKRDASERVNYKNYLKEIEPVRKNNNKENHSKVENVVKAVKDPSKGQLQVLVTDIDARIKKTYKNSADSYVQGIKAKLELLNKLS